MKTATTALFTVLLIAVAPAWAASAAAANADHDNAADRCEKAVGETIERVRGHDARDVQFVGARRLVSTTDENEIAVKGEGHYHRANGSATAFTYSCAFNPRTGGTSGVLFKDAAGAEPTPSANWQPDLSRVSPENCEAAVAAVLKDKHPRASRIAFNSETRQLKPATAARLLLEGQGALQRAAGMNAVTFRYRCEFDESGKVLSAQAIE